MYLKGKIMPYEDDGMMTYDNKTHKYTLTEDAVLNKLNVNLVQELGNDREVTVFLEDIREQIYDYIYANPYPHAKEIAEYRIARFEDCRESLLQAMIYQVQYAIRTGKDIDEYNPEALSKRAKRVLTNYPHLAHKGQYNYRIDPKELRVDY